MIETTARGVLAAVALFCIGCDAHDDAPYKSTNVPDQCGACGSSQICVFASIRFGLCNSLGPELCDASIEAGGTCSGMCVHDARCQAPPAGCSPTDCECIIDKMCPETNNNGGRCGGFCDILGDHAQAACLSCS